MNNVLKTSNHYEASKQIDASNNYNNSKQNDASNHHEASNHNKASNYHNTSKLKEPKDIDKVTDTNITSNKKQSNNSGRITLAEEHNRTIFVLKIIYQLEAVKKADLVSYMLKHRVVKTQSTGRKWLERMKHCNLIYASYLSDKGRRRHMVCQMTDKGISYLTDYDSKIIARRARNMRHHHKELLYRIEISRFLLELDWTYLGSKDAKRKLALPSNTHLSALITSPQGQSYLLYYLNEQISALKLDKLSYELGENNKYHTKNLLLYSTQAPQGLPPSVTKIVDFLAKKRIYPASLLALPDTKAIDNNIAIECLHYGQEENVLAWLASTYTSIKEIKDRYGFASYYVEDAKKHKHLVCSYLERDQIKLELLASQLTFEEYKRTGYKAIILTWLGYLDEVKELVDSYQKNRDFISIKVIDKEALKELLNRKKAC